MRCTLPRVGRAVWLSVVVAACTLALPCTASAEPLVDLGPADSPARAVTDGAGTLHVVWDTHRAQPSDPLSLTYCRVPAGATACSSTQQLGVPGGFAFGVHLLRRTQDGALIVVFSGREPTTGAPVTYVLTSLDGGATWSPAAIVGAGLLGMDAAALTADGQAIDTVGFSGADPLSYQRVGVTGPPESRVVAMGTEPNGTKTTQISGPHLVNLPDGRPMLIVSGVDLGTRDRILRAGVDPFQDASWSAWSASPRLHGPFLWTTFGPNGVWELTDDGAMGLRVWRFDGRRFVRPRSLGTIGGPPASNVLGAKHVAGTRELDFVQDGGGRLHVAWVSSTVCGRERHCLLYRRNEPRGFQPLAVYPLPRRLLLPDDITVAPNEGGSGWIVWIDGADVVDGAHNFATPLVTPPRGSRIGSRRLGRSRRITVPTHYACVAPGGRFVHRALLSGRRRGVTIVSVRFSFDGGQLARTDHHAPYRTVYRLSFDAGTRHVAEARVTYRLNGRTRHTSIGRAIVMCP
jgi:hypothetical protein